VTHTKLRIAFAVLLVALVLDGLVLVFGTYNCVKHFGTCEEPESLKIAWSVFGFLLLALALLSVIARRGSFKGGCIAS
jgi:hypothetical protein